MCQKNQISIRLWILQYFWVISIPTILFQWTRLSNSESDNLDDEILEIIENMELKLLSLCKLGTGISKLIFM
jgi:hypothetical protein